MEGLTINGAAAWQEDARDSTEPQTAPNVPEKCARPTLQEQAMTDDEIDAARTKEQK